MAGRKLAAIDVQKLIRCVLCCAAAKVVLTWCLSLLATTVIAWLVVRLVGIDVLQQGPSSRGKQEL